MLQFLTKMVKILAFLYLDIELCIKLNGNDEKMKKQAEAELQCSALNLTLT